LRTSPSRVFTATGTKVRTSRERIPAQERLIRLFNPWMDEWAEHFEWTGSVLAGRTAIGRVTIQVLAINEPDIVAVREALSEEQTFPLE
jgi:hypothetical protein